ncbi:SNF1-interacting protein [Neonectria magnoliae]|uniref:SNF1-interacting protein n=1 Tax=Neonectria magnoliae TaxID=2732573 RepID=A0ABR1I669_9HYPO
MGNSNTKESRPDGYDDGGGQGRRRSANGDPIGLSRELARESGARSRNRTTRPELNIFGLGSSSSRNNERQDVPFERRETRQEREARKLEKERIARAKERERSIREEHVDGGYLVTLGTYTGTEDFSKPVVRQLLIERKLAPFWRGLSDWSSSWNEHQLIAAARGLPIPAADATPDPELIPIPPPPTDPQSSSSQNLHSLTVPMGPRSLSVASDRSGSAVGSSLPSPTSAAPTKSSSPFKPRAARALAALSMGSRNASSTDLGPKEVALPHDPFVNGQPTEVFLYKDADDCPICFLSYPPYLNHTRCCDQPICTECFVQIKRADPHLREHHPDGETRNPNEGLTPDDPPEMLISEPSACPYCQQPEFGVTYEPPPFRRGLVYSSPPPGNFSSATAMSSQSSLNSTLPPMSPSHTGRRRTHSLSANAPNVITTDRVRPDWASKLASARAHQARRAAAATALHTAAFLMGGSDQRSSILRPGRFSRRNTGNNSSANTPIEGQVEPPNEATEGPEPGARGSSRNLLGGRRNRMDELEEMMFMEAVRLSLAAEEDRKRKEEKAYRKEAKKREKEERKAAKKQGGNPYSGTTSGASASSLSLGGIGRRRGNSAASNLRMEATVSRASQHSKSPEPSSENKGKDQSDNYTTDKGKGVDRGTQDSQGEPSSSSSSLPLPATATRGGSHLRQMSNASSIGGSSNGDSPTGSFTGPGYMGIDGNPRSSGLSLGSYSDDGDRDAGSAGSEPMFNFSSLAQMVGADIDGNQGGQGEEPESPRDIPGHVRPLSQVKEEDKDEAEAEHVEERGTKNTLSVDSQLLNNPTTPELTITPETPALGDADNESKQLGYSSVAARTTRLGQ